MKQDYDRVKHIVIIINASMGILYGIVHGIRAFSEGYTVLGVVDVFVSAFFILILIHSIKRPCSKIQYYSTVSLMSVFFLYLFVSGGVHNTGYLWSLIIPLSSIFMLGWRHGALFTVGFFIAMTGSVCLDFWGAAVLNLPDQETLGRLFSVYIIAGIVAVAYELGKNRTENELKRAKLKAEKASLAKSEFLAVMSHEIRTPLHGVLGSTELLLKTPLNTVQKEYAEIANVSGRSLLGILDDILDFSKIEAGKLSLDKVKTDIRELLGKTMEMVSFQSKLKEIGLTLTIPPETPPFIFADPVRLRQIIVNLLNNAVKFTDEGEIELRLSFVPVSDEMGSFTFSVRDTGIGISRQQQEKLFKPFSQADTSISRKFGGTGLGLTISKLLVEKMDGTIGLESEEGKGSTFSFTIETFYFTSEEDHLPVSGEDNKDLQEALTFQKLKVLVVEDVPMNILLLRSMLSKILPGSDIIEASNGNEAVEKISRESFDLILMDIQMPELDGIEATKKIRESEKKTGTRKPVIAITAGAVKEQRDSALENGMDDFVTKPVSFDKLRSVMKRFIP